MSMNVSLTPELEEYARSQVEDGLYGSISEFMRSAVRLHRKQDIEHNLYLRDMHKELSMAADQIDNGTTEPHHMQDIINEVKAELSGQPGVQGIVDPLPLGEPPEAHLEPPEHTLR